MGEQTLQRLFQNLEVDTVKLTKISKLAQITKILKKILKTLFISLTEEFPKASAQKSAKPPTMVSALITKTSNSMPEVTVSSAFST